MKRNSSDAGYRVDETRPMMPSEKKPEMKGHVECD